MIFKLASSIPGAAVALTAMSAMGSPVGVTTNPRPTAAWKDVTSDGATPSTCDETPENCTLRDLAAKRDWNRSENTLMNRRQAKQFCDDLEHNGQTDWRLPSVGELTAAFNNGIFSAATPTQWRSQFAYQLPDSPVYWSVSSTPDSKASVINLQHGHSWTSEKHFTYRVICTRAGTNAGAPSAEETIRRLNHERLACQVTEEESRYLAEQKCSAEIRSFAQTQCRKEGYSRSIITKDDGISLRDSSKETVWGNPVWNCTLRRCWVSFQCSDANITSETISKD